MSNSEPRLESIEIVLRLAFGRQAYEALEPLHREVLQAELRKGQGTFSPICQLRDRVELAGGLLNFCSLAVIDAARKDT